MAHAVCGVCIAPFSLSPVILAHASQPLKDDIFTFLSVVTCLSVLALLRVRTDTVGSFDRWFAAGALGCLGAAAYALGGIPTARIPR